MITRRAKKRKKSRKKLNSFGDAFQGNFPHCIIMADADLLSFIRGQRTSLADIDVFRLLEMPLPSSLVALEAAQTSKKRKKLPPTPKFTDEAILALYKASRGGLPRQKLLEYNTIEDVVALIER